MVEQRELISENLIETVRKVLGIKKQALTNIVMNKASIYKFKTEGIEVKKSFYTITFRDHWKA